MSKVFGPLPSIDGYKAEWESAIKLEEAEALDDNKVRLDILRRRDKNRTQEKIDGLYDDLQRVIDPSYQRAPSAADISAIYAAAESLINSWDW